MAHRPFIKTLRAQWLGQHLRKLREQRGMTLRLVSEHLHRDMSALARYERGEWPIRKGDVEALLDLYGFHYAGERARILGLAEEVWRTDRWDEDYGDVVDSSFIDYPWLESRAVEIKSYNPVLPPGLFQTRPYAEAVIRSVEPADTPEPTIKRYVTLRMERQQVLRRESPPRIGALIDEAALRGQVGGAEVMRGQLETLAAFARRPGVEIQVVPADAPLHVGCHGGFTIFTMPKPYPAVAYLEYLGGRLYLESPKSQRFVRAYDAIRKLALDPRASAELITSIAEELS